ncbi:hypothetical protein DNH61_21380 [Paenibacillus sambharensis]|uniref:Uncharacterized protein n=1 Tax=Paenibacillus sambharensis TaxID=1803190 RepID=A0A2W1LQT3_9BACL|nr:hypothetical protein [Paenibacillus sambharensis]PZD93757.1 hypothetical protein DNH61_21380 [Paenibacillus sambharensis]
MNNIQLNFTNNTNRGWRFVLFQKLANVDQSYDKIEAIAWQVLPLSPAQKQTATYPISTDLVVEELNTPYTSEVRQTSRAVDFGQKWEFINSVESTDLNLLGTQNIDSSISCNNTVSKVVDISLFKNGAKLVTKKAVQQGDTADFLLTPKLYVMYANDIQVGNEIRSSVQSNITEIDLTGRILSADISLELVNATSGQKAWNVVLNS